MKYILGLASLLLFVGCAQFQEQPPLITDDSYAFETPKNFILGVEMKDVGFLSRAFLIQRNGEYISYKEDTNHFKTLCTNIDTQKTCMSGTGALLDTADYERELGLNKQTVRRLVGKETSLTGSTSTTTLTQKLLYTTSDPEKTPKSLLPYFGGKEEHETDTCFRKDSSVEKENEVYCYSGNLMPLYIYTNASTIPVSLSRALFAYHEVNLTDESLRKIYGSLKDEMLGTAK